MERAIALAVLAGTLVAAGAQSEPNAGPLRALPYTPSLDPAAMDPKAGPCTDFYRYACGGWMQAHPIPADEPSWSVYGKLQQENQRFLWGILEDLAQAKAGRTPDQQKLGDDYASCMDVAAIDRQGAAPLKPWLSAIESLRSIKELAPLLARLQLANLGFYDGQFLFAFGSEQNLEDSSQMVAVAQAGGLGLPDRDYYTRTDAKSEQQRQQYRAHVQRMLLLLGDGPSPAAREADAIFALEAGLAKAALTLVEKRDPHSTFHKMTVAQLQQLTPSFDWPAYLAALGLPDLATLNVEEPAFEKALEQALQRVPLADWKSYLRWHLVNARAPFLSTPFAQANFDFFKHTLRGVPEQRPRWKRCVSWIDIFLGEALGREFVRRTFAPDTKQRALEMTRQIEAAMEAELRGLDWMGPATREQALEKLHAVANKIGFPDHWRDYGPVTISRDDFAGDVERAETFESRRWIRKVGKPVDRSEWFITPPTVDAYYDPQMNDMNFPAGVLQPPLFDVKLDDAPNYGDTGATIGHELTHGFDDNGRQFDAHGNLRDWWTPQDAAAFNERIQCVIDEYGRFPVVDDLEINSKLTQGEDVADLGGTWLAYLAWRKATAHQQLHDIGGFTPDQRFFIGMAQWACENQRPENLRSNALTDPHSPGRYRVNGVLANLPAFQRAFSCKAGSPMVCPKPCRVW